MTLPDPAALDGLSVFERGWLSSNNVLLHGRAGEGAVLVDTSHCVHAAQTVQLVRRALGGERLARIVNTHLHSDHCGGNAALQDAFPGVRTEVPPGGYQAARDWDEARLSYRATRQRCDRYTVDGVLQPGSTLAVGGRAWEVIAAPGHDPDSVVLFDADRGVLISADALWANGFGVIFPELDGESGFDETAAVLDLIERLPVRVVIPGHGAPFGDVADALARARSRLASWRAAPDKHVRHAAKVLIKYHLMEEREQSLPDFAAWAAAAPLMATMFASTGRREDPSPAEWALRVAGELVAAGVLKRDGASLRDA